MNQREFSGARDGEFDSQTVKRLLGVAILVFVVMIAWSWSRSRSRS